MHSKDCIEWLGEQYIFYCEYIGILYTACCIVFKMVYRGIVQYCKLYSFSMVQCKVYRAVYFLLYNVWCGMILILAYICIYIYIWLKRDRRNSPKSITSTLYCYISAKNLGHTKQNMLITLGHLEICTEIEDMITIITNIKSQDSEELHLINLQLSPWLLQMAKV